MTAVPTLELTDPDGDRIRFTFDADRVAMPGFLPVPVAVELGGHGPEAAWSVEALLSAGHARQIRDWLTAALGDETAAP